MVLGHQQAQCWLQNKTSFVLMFLYLSMILNILSLIAFKMDNTACPELNLPPSTVVSSNSSWPSIMYWHWSNNNKSWFMMLEISVQFLSQGRLLVYWQQTVHNISQPTPRPPHVPPHPPTPTPTHTPKPSSSYHLWCHQQTPKTWRYMILFKV